MADDASAPACLEELVRRLERFHEVGDQDPPISPHASLPDCARLGAAPDPLGNQDEEQRTHHHQDREGDHYW